MWHRIETWPYGPPGNMVVKYVYVASYSNMAIRSPWKYSCQVRVCGIVQKHGHTVPLEIWLSSTCMWHRTETCPYGLPGNIVVKYVYVASYRNMAIRSPWKYSCQVRVCCIVQKHGHTVSLEIWLSRTCMWYRIETWPYGLPGNMVDKYGYVGLYRNMAIRSPWEYSFILIT